MGIYVALFNGVRYVMLQTMKLAWNREFVRFSFPDSCINADNHWWKWTFFDFWRLLSFQFYFHYECWPVCDLFNMVYADKITTRQKGGFCFLMQMNTEACQNRHKIWITYQRSGAGVCLYLNTYVHSWHDVTVIWVRWCIRGKPWVSG